MGRKKVTAVPHPPPSGALLFLKMPAQSPTPHRRQQHTSRAFSIIFSEVYFQPCPSETGTRPSEAWPGTQARATAPQAQP